MAEEFEYRDLSGAVFWDVNLTGATFRDVIMTGMTISHSWLEDIDVDGFVDRVTINGVDVTDYVNERDPWYPLRAMLRPADPEGMRETWTALEEAWSGTIARGRQLTESQAHESVGGEWSFVETLRHLVFAMDKWFTVPILGDTFHPFGIPNSGSAHLDWPGLDRGADPSLDEVLAVRRERASRFHGYLGAVQPTDLTREVEVLENGSSRVDLCLYVVFEEEFQHNRYALRDLAHFA